MKRASPGGSVPANAGDVGSISGLGRSPGEGNGNPLQCSCLGNPMDRGVVGYSPWGHKRVRHDLGTEQQFSRERNGVSLSVKSRNYGGAK